MDNITIDVWDANHPHWSSFLALVDELGQSDWVNFHADWHQQSIILVASIKNTPVGFLRYVIQSIGSDSGLDAVSFNQRILIEAKVIAFGVKDAMRRKGIGRSLQERLIEDSQQTGCYQIRSHSSQSNTANHQLKLSLGFGIHPIEATSQRDGYYFILPL